MDAHVIQQGKGVIRVIFLGIHPDYQINQVSYAKNVAQNGHHHSEERLVLCIIGPVPLASPADIQIQLGRKHVELFHF